MPSIVEQVPHTERQLGETEVSYFLPSRESGVNDMYLHLGCRAPSHLVERPRVSVVWAILRVRHPLLASRVRMNDYNDITFLYNGPSSIPEAIASADQSLEYRNQSKDGQNYDFLICATHFLGDGMALHQFANDFFSLLGSPSSEDDLRRNLKADLLARVQDKAPTLPSAMEERIPRIAARVDFNQTQQKLIGGHTFPRNSRGLRHTIVPTISIDAENTKKILENCKRRGVSVSSALFAICNIAWARTSHPTNFELPTMMYSALNMRPNLLANKALNDSYWFLAIGYFNVVLPSFLPRQGSVSNTFWRRAYSAKIQSSKAAKSPMSVSRCREMAKERGVKARMWAKEDDDKAMGIIPPPPTIVPASAGSSKPKIPSAALMGLSLLGNLDGIYKHSAFPSIKLHTLTTGSRQRAGGMLLFSYTFVEKLWNNFEEEAVKNFWENVISAIHEFLLR
ncbi:hypothetical protein CPB84DRAFT_1812064 [Gymnopilus junonius]|uniref:Uncharacterized protein n=1 Tax=Gymnopilus junonius TaxID=109634 RepID=A0A9P5P3T1_GYMJU|nr:hypothetical protein CPB84DRAFT_1812064 [Gymnopilus junonius]